MSGAAISARTASKPRSDIGALQAAPVLAVSATPPRTACRLVMAVYPSGASSPVAYRWIVRPTSFTSVSWGIETIGGNLRM
jgi:hypothetical protein